ncbi:MAG: hypothetical protein HSCHL_1552 [Hydrogenibacillus schlegelii]|uniref:Uncharacterized protein n=1 Tax=Hydrogenibacillus schlegelii TaxID=1484 RepID=A0A2T5G4D8_HYDSH|nr:MAG: hypothetical protein HSCHL_1552 [Hydrogenibacillus schlegelii]
MATNEHGDGPTRKKSAAADGEAVSVAGSKKTAAADGEAVFSEPINRDGK